MQLSLDSQTCVVAGGDAPQELSHRKKRRGATSMEYCVMVSFILLVLIASVQALGFTVGSLFTSNAAATSKFSSGVKPGP
jgi:Flp pilus assembly pilin Flp